jgi:hypothetical protein
VFLYSGTFTVNSPASQASVSGNTAGLSPYQVYRNNGTINGTAGVPTVGW